MKAADGSIERSRVAGNVSQLNANGTCIPKYTLAMAPPKIMQDSSHFILIFPTTRWIIEPVIGAFGPQFEGPYTLLFVYFTELIRAILFYSSRDIHQIFYHVTNVETRSTGRSLSSHSSSKRLPPTPLFESSE